MVAEAQLPGADSVARCEHLRALGRGALVGALQPAKRQVDPLARGLALDRGEAFGDDQLVGDTEQRVEQAGAACVGIFLDAEDAGEAALRGPPHFESIEPEADPRVRDVLSEVLLRPRHKYGARFAIVQGREELERLGIDAALGFIGAEHAHAIGL